MAHSILRKRDTERGENARLERQRIGEGGRIQMMTVHHRHVIHCPYRFHPLIQTLMSLRTKMVIPMKSMINLISGGIFQIYYQEIAVHYYVKVKGKVEVRVKV